MHNDFLKAQDGKTYVPFTLTLDPALAGQQVALYFRVIDKKAPPADKEAKAEDAKKPMYAFEAIHFGQPRAEGNAPLRMSRAFAVPAGDYDVYMALKTRGDKDVKYGLLKQSVTVPDFWAEGKLTTSSVILAERVEMLKEMPSTEQLSERPYVLGTTEIVPSRDRVFTTANELPIIFLVYNPGFDATKRPDITVEYNFHIKAAEGEKYFNKTSPQEFDASTLPEGFDVAAGQQLLAGQTVPLEKFPPGDYRLEIKVTDNLTKQTLTENVTFTVKGP
jgi:hypothetical protein